MEQNRVNGRSWALLFARLVLGLIFFMAGFWKVFELTAGALVILGLRVREALIALGLVLAIVTFGHLLKEPLYEFHTHVIPRLALLLFVLMLPRDDDRFSLDHFLGRRKS